MLMGHRLYKRLNIFLLLAIFLVNGYVIMLPLLPGIQFWWDHRHGNNTPQKLSSQLQTAAQSQKEGDTPKPSTNPDPPQTTGFVADAAHDGLVIPRLSLQVPVVTGSVDQSLRWLAKGAWLTPASTPDKDSNTVIAGHRFTYTQPRGPFYFLNQLQGETSLAYGGTASSIHTLQSASLLSPLTTPRFLPLQTTRNLHSTPVRHFGNQTIA